MKNRVVRITAADWGVTLHRWARAIASVPVAVYVAGWAARQLTRKR